MARKSTHIYQTEKAVFPRRLRGLMEAEPRTSQEALGNAIGVTRQAVGNYINGQSSPSWVTLTAIARFFDVSADYLLGLSDVQASNASLQQICNALQISAGAVKNMQHAASFARAADMNTTPAKALDLLLSSPALPLLCVCIAKNVYYPYVGASELAETEAAYREMAEIEKALCNKYGTPFYIVYGSRAQDQARAELRAAMNEVCNDAIHPCPEDSENWMEESEKLQRSITEAGL